ncbi:MAG: DUF4124 domain-containing protein [Halieaceae bacterium]|jgi:hypothetical protein|nr:DUF4124 domain-containing protein [Halieaceae bacterium]
MRILLLGMLLLLSQLCTAQIYKSTDEQGNVIFSDTPPASGPSERIQLRETNSAPPPQIIEPLEPDSGATRDEPTGPNYSVNITAPANETTIAMGPGNFSVSASVEPGLGDGALLQLYIDGSASGNPQSSNSWELTNVFRGAHDLSVAVVDKNGDQLAISETVRVYVLRPSVNFENRQNRPPPRPTPR